MGLKQGLWVLLSKRGVVLEKGSFEDDKKHGVWETYNDNTSDVVGEGVVIPYKEAIQRRRSGMPISVVPLAIDKKSKSKHKKRMATIYQLAQILKSKGEYKDGVRQGVWYFYDSNIISTVNYKDGEMDGLFESNYRTRPIRKMIQATYEKGKLVGKWVKYSKTGFELELGNYVDGSRDGEWVFRDVYGRLIRRGVYVKGLQQGQWTFYNYYKHKGERKEYNVEYKDGEVVGSADVRLFVTKTRKEWEKEERKQKDLEREMRIGVIVHKEEKEGKIDEEEINEEILKATMREWQGDDEPPIEMEEARPDPEEGEEPRDVDYGAEQAEKEYDDIAMNYD